MSNTTTDETSADATTASRGGRLSNLSDPGKVLLVAGALVLAQLAFRGWAAFGAWFQFDDIVWLARVIDQPLSYELLTQGYGGHLLPGGFLLTWLYVELNPLGYAPYAATLLLFQTLASVGFLLLLRSLFGLRWTIVPPLAVYLFSAVSLPAFIWWAAGVQQVALQVALVWSLLAHVAYLRSGRFRYVVLTVLALAFGLFFYEKTLLVYGAIGIVTLAYFTTGGFFDRLRQIWVEYRSALLVHCVSGAAYIAYYSVTALNFGQESGDQKGYLDLFGNLVAKTFATGLLGGPVDWEILTGPFQLADPSTPIVLAACIVLAALVVLMDLAYLRARRAWALPIFFLVCNLALLTSARASVLGAVVGLEYRYITEMSLVFALSVALAMMPIRGAKEGPVPASTEPTPVLSSREWMTLATVGVVILSLVSSYRFVDRWISANSAKVYFANADRTLGTVKEPTPLVNVSVPQTMMWGYEYPRNTTKYVLAMHKDRMAFPSARMNEMKVLDEEGIVRPMGISQMSISEPGRGDCGYPSSSARAARIKLATPVDGVRLWARISYAAKQPTTATIMAGRSEHEIKLERGLRNVWFQLDGRFNSIRVETDQAKETCLYDAEVGVPFAIVPPDEREQSDSEEAASQP